MAFDAFMYFPKSNVRGETQDKEMDAKEAFELKSFEFGAENTINIGSQTGGGGAGKASFKDFTITKQTDSSSCPIFAQLCEGKHFKDAVIELRRSGGKAGSSGATFMKFHFKMVMVKDMSWNGSEGDDVCEETIIFVFGAIKVEYFRQKMDGSHVKADGDGGEVKWSQKKNLAVFDA